MHDGITYCTGTRVYQVTKLHQHIPRKLYNMFGKTIICIYNDQTNNNSRPKKPEFTPNETYTDYETDTTQTQSDTESGNDTENQAETQNKPQNKPQKEGKKPEQNIHQNVTCRKQYQKTNKSEFTMDKTPPENNKENYPTMPNTNSKQKQEQSKYRNRTEEPTIIPDTQIRPETQTDNSSPHTQTNDVQQPELPKSNASATEQHNITNTQIQSPSQTLVSNRFQILQNTPYPENIDTPDLNTDINNHDMSTPDTTSTNTETENEILTPTSPTPKTKRQIRLEVRLFKAKKFTTQLQKQQTSVTPATSTMQQNKKETI